MNFIELRVEEYIDEVLDVDESDAHEHEIQVLRKFATYLDRETDVYSIQEITSTEATDFLRTLRNIQERNVAVDTLNGFFAFLSQKGLLDEPLQLDVQAIFRAKPAENKPDIMDFVDDEDDRRYRPRRDLD
jgi:hypothetical protein